MKGPRTIAIFPPQSGSEADTLKQVIAGLQNYYTDVDFSTPDFLEFSQRALDRYIEIESRHGQSGLNFNRNNPFGSLSSGEKRKVLLDHLLGQHPEVLILFSPLESLDAQNRAYFIQALEPLHSKVWMIQILYRKEFLLAWTDEVLIMDKTGALVPESDHPRLPKFQTNSKGPIPLNSTRKEPATFSTLVKMNGVSLHYKDRCILKDIFWEVKPREFWELSGPNGSGKSSLIGLITGDNHKAYGQPFELFDRPRGSGESVWDIKSQIGYFTPNQLQGFGGYQSAEALLISGYYDSIGLYQTPSDRQQRIAREWLNWLDIPNQVPFRKLSPGQQRMLMTVRAVLKFPPLLILDEPTLGLSPEQIAIFVELVNSLHREIDCSIIYVSHHPEQGLLPTQRLLLKPSAEGSRASVSQLC